MSRIVYREREREREYDNDDYDRRGGGGGFTTTVKRYQIPDRDDDVEEKKIVIKTTEGRPARSEVSYRERDRPREDVDVRITERVTERERIDDDRRDVSYRFSERESDRDRFSGARSDYRVIEREREISRAPSPPVQERTREYRFEREREYSPARAAREERPYDLERYSRTTDYYSSPQPIVIRERAQAAPIIIDERREPQKIIIRREREEPNYEIIERNEVRDDRQLVRRDDATTKSVVSVKQQPQDEDYYYERRVREVARRREDDIRPSDSASQASDESYEYVRREKYVEDERDRSPHHKRHLAEGAALGAGAAAILRQHRKSQGRESNHGVRDVVGGGALGALGAELVSRARSRRGSSRRRSFIEDDDRGRGDRRYRSRSRSREQSKSRLGKLGTVAAVAAVGAIAGYAIKNSGKNKETLVVEDHRRRSRSRRRRGSSSPEVVATKDSALNPEHRNRRIAQAGLASAAAAGIWERMRSKSRGGRERSKSRLRTGLPIVATGLGGAALAGLYEKNKANKEAKKAAIIEDELHRGRRHRSRSRSRSVPPDSEDGRRSNRRDMVAYGNDPIYPDERNRGYYSDEEPGRYHRRTGSAGSSPDTRHRSRSRGRNLAETGAAVAAGAAIGHEIGRSRERSRSRHDRDRRHDDYDDMYSDDYRHGGYITPPANDHYPPQAGQYPNSNYFAPPPTGETTAREGVPVSSPVQHDNYQNYQPYNPADYPPAAAGAPRDAYPPNGAAYGAHTYDPATETAAARELQEDREMQAERERNRAARNDPGNVSTFVTGDRAAPEVQETRAGMSSDVAHETLYTPSASLSRSDPTSISGLPSSADGLSSRYTESDEREGSRTPRARSTSRVRFDLGNNTAHAPDETPRQSTADLSNGAAEREHRRRRHSSSPTRERTSERRRHRHRGRPSSTLMNDPHDREPSTASDETIEMPQRFDEHGNRKPGPGDDFTSRISALFGTPSSSGTRSSGGGLGDMLRGIAGEVLRNVDDRSGGRSSGRR